MINFVSFGTDNCEELLEYFYKSLVDKCNEEFTLHYYSVNYESSIKGDNLVVNQYNTNKTFKRGNRHISSSTKSELNPVFLKPNILIKSLIDIDSDNFIYLDLDILVTKNFNSEILFSQIKKSNTPLSPQHFWEFPMDYRDPNNIKCFGGDLCEELSMERSGKLWSQNCMIVYSKKHLDFLLDWNSYTSNDKLRNIATGDEEIYNVTLWSYNQNGNLGTACISNGIVDIRKVGQSRFEDILECYKLHEAGLFNKYYFITQNKMTSEMTDQSVMIFHGINVKDFKNLDSSKNLIYYTVSGDLKYLELLEISIKSLIDLGKYKDDILIICDSNIKENININYPNLKFMLVDKVDGNLSAGNKLRVYEYSHLSKYDNILFLDSDTLIINDINLLFKESNLVKDKFIVSSEIGLFHNNRVITNNGHAGELLTEDQKITYKDIPCINSGCFLFRNNKENLEILKETYNLYINGKRFHLYEQPYFNYVLLMKNKFIHNLQSYVSHTSLVDKEKSIIHYCGSVGNFQSKFKFMKRDLELLKIDKNLISYDSNIINIWIDNDSIFINSSLDIFDSKVIIWDDDLFMYKELVNFSKGANFWFKPGKKLEDFKKCQVEVLDKYDNLITKYVKL